MAAHDAATAHLGAPWRMPTDAFSCPGCSFAGWALSTDEDAVYGDGQAVVNLTTAKGATVVLYAV